MGSLVEVLKSVDTSMMEIWENVSYAYGASRVPKDAKDRLRRAFNAIKDVEQSMRGVRHLWTGDSRQ
jgi:ppGpp synthetase/RelA/SpoT-type nucleotidyltranferase